MLQSRPPKRKPKKERRAATERAEGPPVERRRDVAGRSLEVASEYVASLGLKEGSLKDGSDSAFDIVMDIVCQSPQSVDGHAVTHSVLSHTDKFERQVYEAPILAILDCCAEKPVVHPPKSFFPPKVSTSSGYLDQKLMELHWWTSIIFASVQRFVRLERPVPDLGSTDERNAGLQQLILTKPPSMTSDNLEGVVEWDIAMLLSVIPPLQNGIKSIHSQKMRGLTVAGMNRPTAQSFQGYAPWHQKVKIPEGTRRALPALERQVIDCHLSPTQEPPPKSALTARPPISPRTSNSRRSIRMSKTPPSSPGMKHLLVVSDRSTSVQIVKSAAKKMGMIEVITAPGLNPGSADFGVEAAAAIAQQYADAVILETQIKGGTCIKTATILRKHHPTIPLICLLTTVSLEDQRGLEQLHDAYILPKPFHTKALQAILSSALYRE